MTRVVYTAYGTATEMGEDSTGAGVEYAFDGPLYCGYWHDTETGLSQTQNRYYNPNLSTWINRDPIGYGGGSNLYEYVGDAPTAETDPFGLAPRVVNGYTVNEAVGGHHIVPVQIWQETGLAPEALAIWDTAAARVSQPAGARHLNTAHGLDTGYNGYVRSMVARSLARTFRCTPRAGS